MLETVSWTHIALIFGSSLLITVLVFFGLVWRDYRASQHPKSSAKSSADRGDRPN